MNTSAIFSASKRIGLILSLSSITSLSFAESTHPTFQRCYQERVTITASSAEIPTPIKKPKTIIPLGCDRPFVYRGELYSADSPQAQDASTLRSYVSSVPEADALLGEYQSKREKSKLSAYTGTAGLLILLLAGPISQQFTGDSRDSIRGALRIAGAAIAAGGFFYSFTLLRTNEYLVPKAVNKYNEAKPNDPIELRFSTGWTF